MATTTTRRPGPQAAASSRRQEILDVATVVFAEKGIAAATVRDIAERAGILSGSLYHHFSSKDEIVRDILEPVIQSQLDAFDAIAAAAKEPREIIHQLINAAVEQTAKNPDAARILRNDDQRLRELAGLERVLQQRSTLRQRWETAISQGIATGQFRAETNPRVTARAISDLVLGAFRNMPPIGSMTPTDVADQLAGLVLGGLLA